MTIRTRFGPSPTGLLHVGGVRTALFNFLFARHSGGKFILRIEDTDRLRSRHEFESAIIRDLDWLGLDPDEGPSIGGTFAPYRQSERFSIYRKEADRLLEKGLSYRCWCTEERLASLRKSRLKAGLPPRYDGRCRDRGGAENPPGVSPAIRFRVPEMEVSFTDLVHGKMVFDTRAFGDFIIISSDGTPAYNFAAAVDDALMEITHVIRGDDHLPNTPRQLLLYRALGLAPPLYCHIPLVLAYDRTPLGKRQAAASISALREEGFLPETILNAVARLGWSPGEGLLSLKEMIKAFSVERLSKSPSVFNAGALKHYNKRAIEALDAEDIVGVACPGLEAGEKEFIKRAVEAVRPNAVTLKDFSTLLAPFRGEPLLSEEARGVLKEPHAAGVIKAFLHEFEKMDGLDETAYNGAASAVKESTGEKGKRLLLPLRCALTGSTSGIELAKVVGLLGHDRIVERLKKALCDLAS